MQALPAEGVRATHSLASLQLQAILTAVGLACLEMSCTIFTAQQLAFSLCIAGFVRRPLATWSAARNNSRCPVALARLRSVSFSSLWRIASLRQYVLSCLTVFRRFSAINHHLVDWQVSQYLRHHCERFGLALSNNTLNCLSLFRLSR